MIVQLKKPASPMESNRYHRLALSKLKHVVGVCITRFSFTVCKQGVQAHQASAHWCWFFPHALSLDPTGPKAKESLEDF